MTKKSTLSPNEIATGRMMSRRAITLLGAATVGAASALGVTGCCLGALSSGGGCSDNDPSDGLGRGTHCATTGCTDSDPSDGFNSGRNCGGTPVPPTTAPPAGGTTP